MTEYKIQALRVTQKQQPGHEIFLGKISVGELIDPKDPDRDSRFLIHQWKSSDEEEPGYQRFPDQKRIDKVKNYIQVESARPTFPTSLLVSARSPLSFNATAGDYGELTINQQLFVIDGQHRIEAFKDMVKVDELKAKYGYMELPIVILSNFKYSEEVEQFFVINSRQRKIKTDLAQRIYLELSKEDIKTELVPEKDKWQVVAAKIVDSLNRDPLSIWYQLIELPNDEKDVRKERLISQNYFIKSLKPFFTGATMRWNYSKDTSYNGRDPLKECPPLLEAYWKAIRQVYGEAFIDKKKYVLFKTVGVVSLHMVLAEYMKRYPAQSQDEQIQGVKALLEYARDKNKFTSEFWQVRDKDSSENGVYAGAFSSGAGHNRIAMAILNQRKLNEF